MQKIYTLITAVLVSTLLSGQSPSSFKYQAVLRNVRGDIRANADASILIAITKTQDNGVVVYSETHKVKTDNFGLIDLVIGKGTPILGNFSAINWSNGTYSANIAVDGLSMGSVQFHSVPYSLFAEKAGNGFSGNYNDLTNKPVLFDGTWLGLAGKPTFSTVATSGSYNDLTNKPTLFDGTWLSLANKPTFSTVATSGSYNDLTDRPNISASQTKVIAGINVTVSGSGTTENPYVISASISKDNKEHDLYMKDDGAIVGLPRIVVEKPYGLVPTVTDVDGNIYGTVKIGTQVWMAENLKTTKYRNGDLIGTTSPATLDILGEATPKYQWALNGDESTVNTYGRLYTWYAVSDNRNVCPAGWHVPTEIEFKSLITYLGSVAGGRLKESGTAHWSDPNVDDLSDSKFNALGAGVREVRTIGPTVIVRFFGLNGFGVWWGYWEDGIIGTSLVIWGTETASTGISYNANYGLSVRCILN